MKSRARIRKLGLTAECIPSVISIMLLLALPHVGSSQSVTGQICGTVADPAEAVVLGARVRFTHDLSKQVREFRTESNGSFVFTGLVPGDYSLRIAQPGFRVYQQHGIVVAAQ